VVLMALQLLVVNRAWELSPQGWGLEIYVGVLFALGGTMILGSALLWLDRKYLIALTVVFIVVTELLNPDPSQWDRIFAPLTRLLLVPGGDRVLWVNYPILPWLGLVTLGMIFGHWLADDPQKAFDRALGLGVMSILAFLVIRYLDGYGNVRPREGSSWIDFLNVVKYPPSIAFSSLSMGTNLVFVGLFARASERVRYFSRPLVVFGRVPLFFYLTHLFLYAGLGLWLTPNGTTIPRMYSYWLLGLLVLFPFCFAYGQLKHRRLPNSLLRYL
jgi:uncharacterized membrane protein